jgi:hypothetical protein
MGFFTWRATRRKRREVQGSRQDLKKQARQANVEQWRERIERMEEDVKALPQEGKDELDALRKAEMEKGNFKQFWGSETFIKEQEKIIRKYKPPQG